MPSRCTSDPPVTGGPGPYPPPRGDGAPTAGARHVVGILDPVPAADPGGDAPVIDAAAVRRAGSGLPLPGAGDTTGRWATLARAGRHDLGLGRLVEGHADAVAILAEHGRTVASDVLHGVWASRAGGGAQLATTGRELRLRGRVRFCSGTHLLHRSLVVARAPEGTDRLVEVDLRDHRVERCAGTWRAPGMAASDTDDVVLHDVPVSAEDLVGGPGAYTGRPGFWWGGAGVAAVWLGGAAGIVDDVAATLRGGRGDEHRLAGLGAVAAAVTAADALLAATARRIDAVPSSAHRTRVQLVRSAVERACRTVLDEAPAIAGVAAIAGADRLPARLADLQVYLRQHHGGRDLAELGRGLLDDGPAR